MNVAFARWDQHRLKRILPPRTFAVLPSMIVPSSAKCFSSATIAPPPLCPSFSEKLLFEMCVIMSTRCISPPSPEDVQALHDRVVDMQEFLERLQAATSLAQPFLDGELLTKRTGFLLTYRIPPSFSARLDVICGVREPHAFRPNTTSIKIYSRKVSHIMRSGLWLEEGRGKLLVLSGM